MSDRDTLMLEIFERLGSIDERLKAGSKRHDEFAARMSKIEEKIEPLPSVVETVKNMKPIVDDYQQSRNKMAGVVLACTTIAGGIGFFASELKGLFLGRHY